MERGIRFKGQFAILLLLASLAPAVAAARRPVDATHSRVLVDVSKSGFLSVFAHDHSIQAPIASGYVDSGQRAAVELRFETGNLRVLDPELPADTRQEIEQTMLGSKVLDASQFPEILFVSRSVAGKGPGGWRVVGELTLHGQTHPVTLDVAESGGVYEGSVEIRQTDFGIKPIQLARGTVKVKDVVLIHFEIRLQVPAQSNERKTSKIP
ncbi:MAG: YceI family protein [Acidobacteriota bacterium]|nr:YceI family protein [Acidobacteriota bacterium]